VLSPQHPLHIVDLKMVIRYPRQNSTAIKGIPYFTNTFVRMDSIEPLDLKFIGFATHRLREITV